MPVHFAGHPCRMDGIVELARRHGLRLVEDAAHAIESACPAGKVGAIGDFTAFSFYATKNLTTGEGGMLTTEDDALAARARLLSLHGISKDAWKRYAKDGPLHWETLAPGYKYNMFDIQAALGLAQLDRLEEWWRVRATYVRRYREALADVPEIRVLGEEPDIRHAYHLFVIILDTDRLRGRREDVMADLRAEGIGTGIHFRSLTLHPFYRERYDLKPGEVPVAESVSERLLSLPSLSPDDHERSRRRGGGPPQGYRRPPALTGRTDPSLRPRRGQPGLSTAGARGQPPRQTREPDPDAERPDALVRRRSPDMFEEGEEGNE